MGDAVFAVKSDTTSSSMAVTNLSLGIIVIRVGDDCVSGRDYGFSSVGGAKHSYGED